MARQIIWTFQAQDYRKRIFEYWNVHNKSNLYSKKLNRLFKESLKLVCKRLLIGKRTNVFNVRAKIVRDYMIFYEITDEHIVVLTIWDSRQNPTNSKFDV
ncbi:MAG: type II toxin-antitoxin system RelE/ParE family toxin [Mangrovibacterium sp.]